MANSLCLFSSPPPPTSCLLQSPSKGVNKPINIFPIGDKKSAVFKTCKSKSFEIQATDGTQTTKRSSIVCQNCEGNGAVECSQCKGGGVNLIDHYNGRFKAGGLCWLCRGKKEVLCGECNGAGFMGGFLSTFDE